MDFAYTDAQKALRDSVREATVSHLADATSDDSALWRLCKQHQLHGLTIPADFGGSGADYLTSIVALESLAAAGAGERFCVALALHLSACAFPIALWGSTRQKQRYLPRLADGSCVGTGTAIGNSQLTCRSDRETTVLNGSIRFEDPLGSGLVVFPTADDDSTSAASRLIVFDIESVDSSLPSVSRGTPDANRQTELVFVNHPVEADHLLECDITEGGLAQPGEFIAVAIAACRVGQSEYVIRTVQTAASRLSRTQKLAGVPSDGFQTLYHRIADLKVQLDAAQLLVYRAARDIDRAENSAVSSALAHLMLDRSLECARQAVQELVDRGQLSYETAGQLLKPVRLRNGSSDISNSPRHFIADSLGI
jgi:alkylation response protein AidB-like acyl-CoA dehydrogenase